MNEYYSNRDILKAKKCYSYREKILKRPFQFNTLVENHIMIIHVISKKYDDLKRDRRFIFWQI